MHRSILFLLFAVVGCQIQNRRFNPSSIIRPAHVLGKVYPRGTTIARSSGRPGKIGSANILDSTRPLPCCKDESGGAICRAMKTNDARGFASKCQTEPDFSLVVCCRSCSDLGTSYRDRASEFFNNQNNATNCFDRMSGSYCSRFQTNQDAWNNKRWSCNAEHYRLGFRVCRATCGFCSIDWKNSPEPNKCV